MTKVHPRVNKRHPELSDADVEYAWEHFAIAATREVGHREMRVGFDLKAREIEMVGVLTADGWLVYHAMTPPSKKTMDEMAKAKGGA